MSALGEAQARITSIRKLRIVVGAMRGIAAAHTQQARNALDTIDKALREAGSSIEDTVRVVYYVADAAYIDEVVAAVGPVFKDIRPAATMLVVKLIEAAMKIEIEVTARIGARNS